MNLSSEKEPQERSRQNKPDAQTSLKGVCFLTSQSGKSLLYNKRAEPSEGQCIGGGNELALDRR